MRLPIQIEAIMFRRGNSKIEYLLVKRICERDGFWQPITGGVEQGETKIEALKREIKEETGIKNLVRIIEDVYYFELSTSLHEKEYVYGVEVLPTEKIVLDKREHSEFMWCGFQEALRLMKWKGNKEALRRLNKRLNE